MDFDLKPQHYTWGFFSDEREQLPFKIHSVEQYEILTASDEEDQEANSRKRGGNSNTGGGTSTTSGGQTTVQTGSKV